MYQYLVKLAITCATVVIVTELSKKNASYGALLASIPLISVMSLFWLYFDTQNIEKVIGFSYSIVWLVLPSLVIFIVLPILLRHGLGFYVSLIIALLATILAYFVSLKIAAGLKNFL